MTPAVESAESAPRAREITGHEFSEAAERSAWSYHDVVDVWEEALAEQQSSPASGYFDAEG